jgi:hypothetical protein
VADNRPAEGCLAAGSQLAAAGSQLAAEGSPLAAEGSLAGHHTPLQEEGSLGADHTAEGYSFYIRSEPFFLREYMLRRI